MNAQGYVNNSPSKSNTGMYIIIAVVVLLLIGGGYYYYTMDDEEDVVVEATVVTPSIPTTNNVVIPDDTYTTDDTDTTDNVFSDAATAKQSGHIPGVGGPVAAVLTTKQSDSQASDDGFPEEIKGCIIEDAENYDALATVDDGSCQIMGCRETDADNYNALATVDDGSCQFMGCMETDADNYNARANVEGECDYLGCTDDRYEEFDPAANKDTPYTSCLTPKQFEAAVSDKPYGRVFSTPSGGNPGHFRYEYQSGGTVWDNSQYVANNDQNNNFSDWTRCNSEADFGTCLEPYIDECYKICDGSTECQGFNVNYKNITENGHKPYCYFYNKSAQLVDTETSAGRAGYIKSEGRAGAPVVLPTAGAPVVLPTAGDASGDASGVEITGVEATSGPCKVTLYSEKNLGGEGVEFTQYREMGIFRTTNFGNRAQSWKREGNCLDKTVKVNTRTMQRGSSMELPGSYDSGNFMGDFVNNIESMKIT
jgi:hypothetical protein